MKIRINLVTDTSLISESTFNDTKDYLSDELYKLLEEIGVRIPVYHFYIEIDKLEELKDE